VRFTTNQAAQKYVYEWGRDEVSVATLFLLKITTFHDKNIRFTKALDYKHVIVFSDYKKISVALKSRTGRCMMNNMNIYLFICLWPRGPQNTHM